MMVVNFRTCDFTRRCVVSVLRHYPQVKLLLIDNGSRDASTEYIRDVANRVDNVTAIFNERNIYHGPAMDLGVRSCATSHVFTLDSDCEVVRGGFLEPMLTLFEDARLYAAGELRYKSRYGYTFGYTDSASSGRRTRIKYIHPYAMLLDRSKYVNLHKFIHHGAPCIKNMRHAEQAGYTVQDFPVADFIVHHAGATSLEHGYGYWARRRQLIELYLEKVESFLTRDSTLNVRYPTSREPSQPSEPVR